MKRMHFGVGVALATLMMAGTASANVMFTLSGVTLSNGGTLVGSFTTNNAFTSLVALDVTASGNGSFAGFDYTLSDSTVTASVLPTFFQVDSPGSSNELRLIFSPTLNGSGSSLTTSSYEAESGSGGTRTVTTGSVLVSNTAVPEPASLAILGAGILGLGAMGWRRRNNRAIS